MIARVLPLLLLLAAAQAPGDGDSGHFDDPFEEVVRGNPDEEIVEGVEGGFDGGLAWSPRSRRAVVDRLVQEWEPLLDDMSTVLPDLPDPPSRAAPAPAEDRGVADPLALRIPADAAAVLFRSLREAEEAVDGLARFLPSALPGLCSDPPGGRREALRRAVEMLLLPTIWRSNPGVRTGTRSVALVVSDPDVRWAPEIALVAEVDDASLVRFHRASTLSWEDRGARRLRVSGLDATADDGSIRSYFALEGGLAIWATTPSLRERILAVSARGERSLAASPGGEYSAGRAVFPRDGGGALLVVPGAFTKRNSSFDRRRRRLEGFLCEAARVVQSGLALRGSKETPSRWRGFVCPSGGTIDGDARAGGLACTVHGSAEFPSPLGTLPSGPEPWLAESGGGVSVPFSSRHVAEGVRRLVALPDPLLRGALPAAARWNGRTLEVLVEPGATGAATTLSLREWAARGRDDGPDRTARRRALLEEGGIAGDAVPDLLRRLTGLVPDDGSAVRTGPRAVKGPPPRSAGGVLVLSLDPGPVLSWRE